jgi:hypothetical protein
MVASLDQNWLSAKYHRTTKSHCLRPSGLVCHPNSRMVKTSWCGAAPLFRDWRRARFLDLVFGECK